MPEFSTSSSTSFGPFLESLQRQLERETPERQPQVVAAEPMEPAPPADPGALVRKLYLLVLLDDSDGSAPVMSLYKESDLAFIDFARLLLGMRDWIEVTGVAGNEIVQLTDSGRATARAFRKEAVRAATRASGREPGEKEP